MQLDTQERTADGMGAIELFSALLRWSGERDSAVPASRFAVAVVGAVVGLPLASTVFSLAPAAGVSSGAASAPAVVTVRGVIEDMAASSARNAWAVGGTSGKSMTWHWNGKSWKRIPIAVPSGGLLQGVATTSPHRAWVVGQAGGIGSGR